MKEPVVMDRALLFAPTPIEEATESGNINRVRELLAAGEDPNRACGVHPPLYWATYNGHLEMVQLLLEYGADPHWKGTLSDNLLTYARTREIVELLEAQGVTWIPREAIFCLLGKVTLEEIRSSDPRVVGETLRTLEEYSQLGEEIWSYCSSAPPHADAPLCEGYIVLRNGFPVRRLRVVRDVPTSLEWAAAHRDLDTVREFLAAGHHPNGTSKTHPPLMRAVLRGRLEIAQCLLEAGADPLWQDRFGYSFLNMAQSREMVHLLERFGATWNPIIPASWLTKQASFDEVRERNIRFNRGYWEDLLALREADDELWWFNSPPEVWARKMGSSGLALVRSGIPIYTLTTILN
jgi:hypothetical protein